MLSDFLEVDEVHSFVPCYTSGAYNFLHSLSTRGCLRRFGRVEGVREEDKREEGRREEGGREESGREEGRRRAEGRRKEGGRKMEAE